MNEILQAVNKINLELTNIITNNNIDSSTLSLTYEKYGLADEKVTFLGCAIYETGAGSGWGWDEDEPEDYERAIKDKIKEIIKEITLIEWGNL